MKWTIKDKPKKIELKKPGHKLVRKFCIFPKSYWNAELKETEWYWLQYVYVAYKYHEGKWHFTPWGSTEYKPAHWEQIGIIDEYSKAVQRGWTE